MPAFPVAQDLKAERKRAMLFIEEKNRVYCKTCNSTALSTPDNWYVCLAHTGLVDPIDLKNGELRSIGLEPLYADQD